MRSDFFKQYLPLIILSALVFQSCGNIDIVKRRYRPGFHVDISKKKDQRSKAECTVSESEVALEKLDAKEAELPTEELQVENIKTEHEQIETLEASTETKPSFRTKLTFENVVIAPFREARKTKLDDSLRRAVFNKPEDEKYGWSTIAIVSTGLGVLGLGLVITAMIFLVSFIFSGGIAFWWIFGLAGLLVGIAGMVTGIVGMRQTGAGEKRGRGFALAGMISGIISLALGLIGLFWGMIYWLINNLGE